MIQISNEEARNFLVSYQNLNGPAAAGHEAVMEYMRKVRCIQFDPLNVVGRNPDLVLQARVKDYRPEILEDLLYRDRELIDAADKMLSIIPREDYPKMARIRRAMTEELKGILSRRGSLDALDILDDIREYIRENGPQPASRVDIGGRAAEGRWGHTKLSSAALDYLYHRGVLGIHSKIGTQKVYDLNSNLLPEEILNGEEPFRTEHDFLRWYFRRRVGSVGLVWNKNTGAWLGYFVSDPKLRTEILRELEEDGELLVCRVEGSRETFYMRKEDAGILDRQTADSTVRFIAPLDNLIWDRGMTEELFGFKYSWEVYIPVVKRKFGYYVLPVLYGNRFVARFEPEKASGKGPLQIKNWWWEPDVTVTGEMTEAVREAFRRFSSYLGIKAPADSVLRKKLGIKGNTGCSL